MPVALPACDDDTSFRGVVMSDDLPEVLDESKAECFLKFPT